MKDLAYYLDLPYEVTVGPEPFTDGSWGYMARVSELPGCECHAGTPDEALADMEKVKALFLETMLGNGLTPPEPSQAGTRSRSPQGHPDIGCPPFSEKTGGQVVRTHASGAIATPIPPPTASAPRSESR